MTPKSPTTRHRFPYWLLLAALLFVSGCQGFVSGMRDYYTKPGGPRSDQPPTRENHYDAQGRYIGYSEKRGNRRINYDETGRWIGHTEEKGAR